MVGADRFKFVCSLLGEESYAYYVQEGDIYFIMDDKRWYQLEIKKYMKVNDKSWDKQRLLQLFPLSLIEFWGSISKYLSLTRIMAVCTKVVS